MSVFRAFVDPIAQTVAKDPSTQYVRLLANSVVEYRGDTAELNFNVLLCPNVAAALNWNQQHKRNSPPPLALPPSPTTGDGESIMKELALEMQRLGASCGVRQQNAVVEDIVDPDYYPALKHRSYIQQPTDLFTALEYVSPGNFSDYEAEYDDGETREVKRTATHRVLDPRERAPATFVNDQAKVVLFNSEHRGSYHWLPSVVRFNPITEECEFLSPINNLPRTRKNERLYRILVDLLATMLPYLITIGEAKPRQPPMGYVEPPVGGAGVEFYNVVVKLQRYHVPPGAEYTGQWHTEGVTEGICSAGVVYVEWPAALSGGAVKFRPPTTPGNNNARGEFFTLATETRENTALVFQNMPHRFETLTNATSGVLTRSFVNFFLASPDLKASDVVPTNADVYLALGRRLNGDVVGDILSYLQLTPMTVTDARALRDRSKAEMVATRGLWGNLFYGNTGHVKWLPSGMPSKEEKEALRTTEYNNDGYGENVPREIQTAVGMNFGSPSVYWDTGPANKRTIDSISNASAAVRSLDGN